jgi:hypothetical protein
LVENERKSEKFWPKACKLRESGWNRLPSRVSSGVGRSFLNSGFFRSIREVWHPYLHLKLGSLVYEINTFSKPAIRPIPSQKLLPKPIWLNDIISWTDGLSSKIEVWIDLSPRNLSIQFEIIFSKVPHTQRGVELEIIEEGVSREFVGVCPRF